MAQELAEKQAESYQEVSAKTNLNIEDLFSKIVEELITTQKKKEVSNAQNNSSPVTEGNKKDSGKNSQNKTEETLKLNKTDSK
jgi:GTPase SAR1 family protein